MDLDASWLEQGWVALAHRWLREAAEFVGPDGGVIAEPNAMVLGTVDAQGHPATRTVLCKGIDDSGVRFFTNYHSQKARELDQAGYASVTFPWISMERQLHFRGSVERVDPAHTQAYWDRRPRGSQLGAWASDQSEPISSRAQLETALAQVTERFADTEHVPVPPFWGGYLIKPTMVEFWQGRPDRLHNRIRCTWQGEEWRIERLQP